jgi:hypothetical protein
MLTFVELGSLLGWLALGCVCASYLPKRWIARARGHAIPPATPPTWRPGRPESPVPLWSRGVYSPGAFLLSEHFGARTWAVCDGSRWALSYEVDGTQRLAGWLDDADVPLEVRFSALQAPRGWDEEPW